MEAILLLKTNTDESRTDERAIPVPRLKIITQGYEYIMAQHPTPLILMTTVEEKKMEKRKDKHTWVYTREVTRQSILGSGPHA